MKLSLSLHARVGLLSISMVIAVFVINMQATINVAEGTVVNKIDDHLDSQIHMLSRAIDRNGQFDMVGLSSVPELVTPPKGWGWAVRTSVGRWHKGPEPGSIIYPNPHYHVNQGIYSGRGQTTTGEVVHVRRLDTMLFGKSMALIVMSPRDDIESELNRIRMEIYKIAAEIILVLIVASVLQIFVGLRPLRKLINDMAKVRSGDARSLPEHQPSDLLPLASEINALIARNHAGLVAARVHAANLAHTVKTPLASLMLQLEYDQASPEAQDLVRHLSHRVAHHLHRARGAMAGLGVGHHSDIGKVAREVKATVALIQRGAPIDIIVSISSPCLAAVEAEDLGEMIGNLVENACRYAHTRVEISGMNAGARVQLHVDDDGPGIAESQIDEALQPGTRLDEVTTGYGLGLAIVRELAELYGGSLALTCAPALLGLRATLDLPRQISSI